MHIHSDIPTGVWVFVSTIEYGGKNIYAYIYLCFFIALPLQCIGACLVTTDWICIYQVSIS